MSLSAADRESEQGPFGSYQWYAGTTIVHTAGYSVVASTLLDARHHGAEEARQPSAAGVVAKNDCIFQPTLAGSPTPYIA